MERDDGAGRQGPGRMPLAGVIRAARPGDAPEIERLYHQSAAYLRLLDGHDQGVYAFDAAVYLRDGFGPRPLFAGLVAETAASQLLGYLIYHWGYDTDHAGPYLFVVDLLVDEAARRRGVGRGLMRRAAQVCRAGGGHGLFWAVHPRNHPAFAFYQDLGARRVTELEFMWLDVPAEEETDEH